MCSLIKTFKATTLAAILICCLTACAVKLAPEYDKAIVTGITSVNQKMMELFAATSSGVEAASYEKREGQYNAITGAIDALLIQMELRPMPPDTELKRVTNRIIENIIPNTNKLPKSKMLRDCKDEDTGKNKLPSICALQGVSKTIAEMRDIDKKQGITAENIKIYKNPAVFLITNALAYESMLER